MNSRPAEKVSQLKKEWKARLLQLSVDATKNIDIEKYLHTCRYLIAKVDEEYIKQMKKCLVIKEMENPLNLTKFQRLKLKLKST